MSEDKFIYTKIDENTYETYDSETKMKIILSFSDISEEEQQRIDNFIIDTLSNSYLDRISKMIEDRAKIRLQEENKVLKSKYFYKQT